MRLDKFLAAKYGSRNKAATAISDGLVFVNGKTSCASHEVKENDIITFKDADEHYVSVGGFKLGKALKEFGFSVKGKVFADIGASTGGFTDCLLQNGAKKVYCIDVGESQLDNSLKCDKTVIIDNFNARNLDRSLFNENLDGAVIDVSFISLTYILGAVADILPDGAAVLALIKPQFECESKNIGKNGIVKNPEIHKNVILKICKFAKSCRLYPHKITEAPLKSGKNIEYIVLLIKNSESNITVEELIKNVKL